MFSRPDIKPLFQPYLFVQLYTDIVPDEFYAPEVRAKFGSSVERQEADAKDVNFEFLRKVFNNAQLPLYVILEPRLEDQVDVIAVYSEGLINNVNQFAEFLRNPDGRRHPDGNGGGARASIR